MANLGYLGLGAMGGRIADRLLSKGHTVIGHNRTKSKAHWLLDKGMTWGDSPRPVAAAVRARGAEMVAFGESVLLAEKSGIDRKTAITAARGLGLEKEDCAVLFHVLAKMSGVPA
jgi:3-hydroxyisobutyrate dehydrogenase-like beta-hydroxyacid dehydrogenase